MSNLPSENTIYDDEIMNFSFSINNITLLDTLFDDDFDKNYAMSLSEYDNDNVIMSENIYKDCMLCVMKFDIRDNVDNFCEICNNNYCLACVENYIISKIKKNEKAIKCLCLKKYIDDHTLKAILSMKDYKLHQKNIKQEQYYNLKIQEYNETCMEDVQEHMSYYE